MTLVDTNVLLDVLTDDPVWASWSLMQLDAAAARGALIINAVIYAELSVRFDRIEELDAILDEARIALWEMPCASLFLAGQGL